MDIFILLKDGTYKAHGDVVGIILLEDNSWVLQAGKPRVESEFRVQITDFGNVIDFSGFSYGEDLGRLEMPKRPERY